MSAAPVDERQGQLADALADLAGGWDGWLPFGHPLLDQARTWAAEQLDALMGAHPQLHRVDVRPRLGDDEFVAGVIDVDGRPLPDRDAQAVVETVRRIFLPFGPLARSLMFAPHQRAQLHRDGRWRPRPHFPAGDPLAPCSAPLRALVRAYQQVDLSAAQRETTVAPVRDEVGRLLQALWVEHPDLEQVELVRLPTGTVDAHEQAWTMHWQITSLRTISGEHCRPDGPYRAHPALDMVEELLAVLPPVLLDVSFGAAHVQIGARGVRAGR